MGMIHKPKEPKTIRKQFLHPINSYRQLYNRLPYPYLRIIHMESHMHFFRDVLKDVVSKKEEFPVEDIQTMFL
jgi:hypothetical protein